MVTIFLFLFKELDLKECYVINGKCLANNYCSYEVHCIVVSYKLKVNETDDINVGLFSLDDGTLLYKFNDM